MNCTNCGKEIMNNAKFCDGCGSPIVSEQASAQASAVQSPAPMEAKENKVVFILAYFGILFFLPLVSCPNSKAGRFHANQGLLLLITSVAGQIAITILSTIILAISLRFWALTSLLSWVWAIAILVLIIIGMMNANKGEQKPLPIIGKMTIIK